MKAEINKKQIFLESFNGCKYDNFIQMINHLTLNYPEYKIILYYRYNLNPKYFNCSLDNLVQIRKRNKEYYHYLKSSKYIIVTSKTFIICGRKYKKQPEQRYLQLWHGIPMKQIGFSIQGKHIFNPAWMWNRTFRKELKHMDYLLTPTKAYLDYFIKAFKLEKFNFKTIETNYPWVDKYSFNEIKINLNEGGKYTKVITYAPTLSDFSTKSSLTDSFLEFIKKNKNYLFIFKVHPSRKDALSEKEIPSNLILNSKLKLPNQYIFDQTDILITDFSSILFDFLAFKKPIANFFTKKEYEFYAKTRGFNIDLYENELTVLNSFEDLQRFIDNPTFNKNYLKHINSNLEGNVEIILNKFLER